MWHFAHPRRIPLNSRAAPRFPRGTEPLAQARGHFRAFGGCAPKRMGVGFTKRGADVAVSAQTAVFYAIQGRLLRRWHPRCRHGV
jgi:hypothetical protein